MKNVIIAAAVCATSVSFADIYYFAGAETASWQDVNSYRVGSRDGAVPVDLPDADDDVWIGGAPTRRQVFKRTANGLQAEPRGMVILMR